MTEEITLDALLQLIAEEDAALAEKKAAEDAYVEIAICGHMSVDVSDAYMACESCGEQWRVTSMVQCGSCHSHVCPICVDSYAYTCGDTGLCFCCDDDAPMGVLPDDYNYDAYEGM